MAFCHSQDERQAPLPGLGGLEGASPNPCVLSDGQVTLPTKLSLSLRVCKCCFIASDFNFALHGAKPDASLTFFSFINDSAWGTWVAQSVEWLTS